MAVHLNARLKTRYIPFLFAGAFLLSLGATLAARASSEGIPPAGDQPQVPREELRAVMDESVDPARLNRRPGFSTIIVAPQPGEPVGEPKNGEEPGARSAGSSYKTVHTLDYSDQLPVQPQEASPDPDFDQR